MLAVIWVAIRLSPVLKQRTSSTVVSQVLEQASRHAEGSQQWSQFLADRRRTVKTRAPTLPSRSKQTREALIALQISQSATCIGDREQWSRLTTGGEMQVKHDCAELLARACSNAWRNRGEQSN
jgi:hypothetical protein